MKQCFLVLILFLSLGVRSQINIKDTTMSIPMFYAAYTWQVPGGDLADRFGANSNIAAGFQWKTSSNWIFGTDCNFMFGNTIHDEELIMTNIKTSTGNIIDNSGSFAYYKLYERGFYINGKFGKLFPVFSSNPNSGIVITGGLGYIQHKIRIEVTNNTAPQLLGDYKKGYDRLAAGFTTNQFIGYQFMSNSRLLNFFGGFEFCQAWTSPQRDVNFDTRLPDPVTNRFDLLNGIRIGWIIPVFTREPEKFYYY
ncbi:MAG: hypothetical protein KQI35_13010 [Bacteroidetes bacterium]|nr:hypothetical protein [Bacteroidota bacterium]